MEHLFLIIPHKYLSDSKWTPCVCVFKFGAGRGKCHQGKLEAAVNTDIHYKKSPVDVKLDFTICYFDHWQNRTAMGSERPECLHG